MRLNSGTGTVAVFNLKHLSRGGVFSNGLPRLSQMEFIFSIFLSVYLLEKHVDKSSTPPYYLIIFPS